MKVAVGELRKEHRDLASEIASFETASEQRALTRVRAKLVTNSASERRRSPSPVGSRGAERRARVGGRDRSALPAHVNTL